MGEGGGRTVDRQESAQVASSSGPQGLAVTMPLVPHALHGTQPAVVMS